ncbi:MAG: Rieske (2Fe-2S) protein [Elusimicrobia bacterium]|nr:Rieske (2Fe-2S) protein [Elusimicrobiota bacterium]
MITRRKFLNAMLGVGTAGWLGSVVYPVLRYLLPPETTEAEPDTLSLGPAEQFPRGAGKIFKFGKRPVLLIRTKDGAFHALAATCTHLDCLVQYRDDMDAVWCACHGGKYDLAGRNIAGPPPKPLAQFAVKVVDGNLVLGGALT